MHRQPVPIVVDLEQLAQSRMERCIPRAIYFSFLQYFCSLGASKDELGARSDDFSWKVNFNPSFWHKATARLKTLYFTQFVFIFVIPTLFGNLIRPVSFRHACSVVGIGGSDELGV